jgi:hypothetical protein
MYNVKQLSRYWVIVKNNQIVTDEELGGQNSFNWECEAWQYIEALENN